MNWNQSTAKCLALDSLPLRSSASVCRFPFCLQRELLEGGHVEGSVTCLARTSDPPRIVPFRHVRGCIFRLQKTLAFLSPRSGRGMILN